MDPTRNMRDEGLRHRGMGSTGPPPPSRGSEWSKPPPGSGSQWEVSWPPSSAGQPVNTGYYPTSSGGGGAGGWNSLSGTDPGVPPLYDDPRRYSSYGATGNSSGTRRQGTAHDTQQSRNRNNPVSTFGFMLNMGYPPPPISLDPLRRLAEELTDNASGELDIERSTALVEEVSKAPFLKSPCVLFVLQQRLHSSRAERVKLALDLTEFAVKNIGVDFAQHMNKEYLKSMTQILKTNSFKERTMTGQFKKVEKFLIGGTSNTGVSTDPRVHYVKQQILRLIQLWADSFMLQENRVPHIHHAYRQLRQKGYAFPPRDPNDRLVGGGSEPGGSSSRAALASPGRGSTYGLDSGSPSGDVLPVTDKQAMNLQRALRLLDNSDDALLRQRCIDIFKKMMPKVKLRIEQLTDNAQGEAFQEQKLETLLQLHDALEKAIQGTPVGKPPYEEAKVATTNLLDFDGLTSVPSGAAAGTQSQGLPVTPSVVPPTPTDPFADLIACFEQNSCPTDLRQRQETPADSATGVTPLASPGETSTVASVTTNTTTSHHRTVTAPSGGEESEAPAAGVVQRDYFSDDLFKEALERMSPRSSQIGHGEQHMTEPHRTTDVDRRITEKGGVDAHTPPLIPPAFGATSPPTGHSSATPPHVGALSPGSSVSSEGPFKGLQMPKRETSDPFEDDVCF